MSSDDVGFLSRCDRKQDKPKSGKKAKRRERGIEVRRIKLSKMNGKERRQTKRRADEGKTGNKKEKTHREIGRGQGGRRKK